MGWKPLDTAPFWKSVEVGGWRHDYGTVDGLEWATDISRRGLLGWSGFRSGWWTHWRDVPPLMKAPPPDDKP